MTKNKKCLLFGSLSIVSYLLTIFFSYLTAYSDIFWIFPSMISIVGAFFFLHSLMDQIISSKKHILCGLLSIMFFLLAMFFGNLTAYSEPKSAILDFWFLLLMISVASVFLSLSITDFDKKRERAKRRIARQKEAQCR